MAQATPFSPNNYIGSARVLELDGPMSCFCGKVLADLGANVIKIEPPGGDPSRQFGPFYHEESDPDKSLFWFSYNTNKRGTTLDLKRTEGNPLFKKLASTADIVIESFPPGYLDSLGLGYPDLAAANPRLIMTSITSFGQDGPRRDWLGSDIVDVAAGGLMYMCGDPDRAPLRMGVSQAHCLAGSQAAVGTLLAHYSRLRTGKGHHVDVSVQEAVANSLTDAQMHWYVDKRVLTRGARRLYGGRLVRTIWPCKDGYVAFHFQWGPTGKTSMASFISLLDRFGEAGELKEVKWETFTGYNLSQEQLEKFEAVALRFFTPKTKKVLYDAALKTRALLFPVSTAKDIVESPQLAARHYFEQVEHPSIGASITYPGAFFKSDSLTMSIRRPAPRLGEHNEEIFLRELGLNPGQFRQLQESGAI